MLISIDGFRHDYLDLADTPNFDRLARIGTGALPLKSVFPTKTFPNHYTLVTGLYPENHGIVGNTMYDPEMDARFSLGNRDAVRDSRWWGGEPIWSTAEKQQVRAGTYFWPGTETEIAGVRPSIWEPYDGRIPNEERVETVLSWMDLDADERPGFFTLYFSNVDDAGHARGPEAPETKRAIENVDRMIGLLIEGLERRGTLERTNILIVSDHGMASTSRDRVVFLDDYVDLEPLSVLDQGALLTIWPNDVPVDVVYEALHEAHPRLTVYNRSTIPDSLRLSGSPRLAPILGIPDVGWSVGTRGQHARAPERYDGGNHGYAPWTPDMYAFFLGAGPAFNPVTDRPLLRNIDLYELMADLLEITPAPNDGSLKRISGQLGRPVN
ncbi:MAG: ectonucleotide pyrophosphatase/phosphodiesterase [Bacteroidota bacterium]